MTHRARTPFGSAPARRLGAPRCAALLAMLAILAVATGCGARRSFPVRPALDALPPASPLRSRSLAEADAWLRHLAMFGEHPRATELVRDGAPLAPRDRLLRALQQGILLHQAGEHARSNEQLEWADQEIDRRHARSVTRAAAALLLHDGVMEYLPTASEQLMLPYYRMLNYLALGDQPAALVESRRANALLARLDRGPEERCGEDGMVLYLAGLVQRSGGEVDDALVSLRMAERALAGCAGRGGEAAASVGADLRRLALALDLPALADTIAERYTLPDPDPAAGESGELLLLVEHGFVAHRAEEAVHLPVLPEEVEGLRSGDGDGVAGAAMRIAARLAGDADAWDRSSPGWDGRGHHAWASSAPLLRLAWPALRLEAARPSEVRVRLADRDLPARAFADLSAMAEREMQRRRAAILGRAVARGLVRYLATREMQERSEKRGGELAGFLVGRLASLAANQVERADLRGWSLLPDRVSLVRARLPAGLHRIRIEALDRHGAATPITVEVEVRPGALTVASRRVYGEESGALPGRWLALREAEGGPDGGAAPVAP